MGSEGDGREKLERESIEKPAILLIKQIDSLEPFHIDICHLHNAFDPMYACRKSTGMQSDNRLSMDLVRNFIVNNSSLLVHKQIEKER